MSHTDRHSLQSRARRRVGMKIGFMIHAAVFVLVISWLYLLNENLGGPRWSVWPLSGWGLGLTIHGLVTLFVLQGEGLRQRMLDAEVERLSRRS